MLPASQPVNVGIAITKATSKLQGGLPRASFVSWFNEIVQDILNVPREWHFLGEPISLPITNNQITLPAGVSEIVSIQVGNLVFSKRDQLSAEEALAGVQGFTLDASGMVITFYPDMSGSASVAAEQDITTDYADNEDTIFPGTFANLFIIGLRMHYYDQYKDGRFTKENMLYQMEISKMKAWDNRRKPLPHYNRHGYVRGGAA